MGLLDFICNLHILTYLETFTLFSIVAALILITTTESIFFFSMFASDILTTIWYLFVCFFVFFDSSDSIWNELVTH